MNKYKVAVYAICKNEEQFVDRWVDSMSEADEIYAADTGSLDNTAERLRQRGVTVNNISLGFWRFDTARNISLSFVPEDMDICVCTDLDEVLDKGWRKKLEQVWREDTTRLKYMYTWSFKPDNTPAVTFWYEKIHARENFRWIHPVHEILEYCGDRPESYVWCGDIHLKHYPDPSKSRGQYLPLLELSVRECPSDDRNMHYLGREYMYYKMWDKCIETLKKHLEMPTAVWRDERAASMRYIARAYSAKGDMDEAQSWLYRAVAEAPHLREPYIEMAKLAYRLKKWHIVYAMVCAALEIKQKPSSYINESFCWDYTPYDLGALAAYELGMKKRAYELAQKAYSLCPDNERLKNNADIIRQNL